MAIEKSERKLTQAELKRMNPAPEGREFMVITQAHGWGVDKDAWAAFQKARKEGSSGEDILAVLADVPEDSVIDQLGRCLSPPVEEGEEQAPVEEIGRFTFTKRSW